MEEEGRKEGRTERLKKGREGRTSAGGKDGWKSEEPSGLEGGNQKPDLSRNVRPTIDSPGLCVPPKKKTTVGPSSQTLSGPCQVFSFPQHVATEGEGEREREGGGCGSPPGQLLNRSCHSPPDSVCWQEAQEPVSPSHKGLIAALTLLLPRAHVSIRLN